MLKRRSLFSVASVLGRLALALAGRNAACPAALLKPYQLEE